MPRCWTYMLPAYDGVSGVDAMHCVDIRNTIAFFYLQPLNVQYSKFAAATSFSLLVMSLRTHLLHCV